MRTEREELAERIAQALPRDGTADPQPGLMIARFARPTDLHHGFFEPCFDVIAQGAKTLTLGEAARSGGCPAAGRHAGRPPGAPGGSWSPPTSSGEEGRTPQIPAPGTLACGHRRGYHRGFAGHPALLPPGQGARERGTAAARRIAAPRVQVTAMKEGIHPRYYPDAKVYYRGEVVMTTGATVPELHVEIWSGSHPFFTGQKSFVDTAGRVEKFQKKYAGDYFKRSKDSKPKKK
jgi:large subunit ribosomal protein L31